MSNNNYSYYYPSETASYPVTTQSYWNYQQQFNGFNGNYARPPPPPPPPPSYSTSSPSYSTSPSSSQTATPPPTLTRPPPTNPAHPAHPPPQQYNYSNSHNTTRMFSSQRSVLTEDQAFRKKQQARPTYSLPQLRFANMSVPPPPPPPVGTTHTPMYPPPQNHQNYQRQWQHTGTRKRIRLNPETDEVRTKITKKKKKPLSQTMPSRKDWTLKDAERAFNIEKEYNKGFHNHSLIIKFPDLELNREIVAKFHPSIDSVHFQQPSRPRFCFVTLKEDEDPNVVIKDLNKTKFGDGFLMAEYKKDCEKDQNIGPEDVDPLTLYVGNLGQEVTKEDMVKAFPKGKRIDIGYAKKMKFTRYAFVSFKTVDDSIDAFKQTHNTQMFNKSLIVRFRRLHGTCGLPGESKTNTPRQKEADKTPTSANTSTTSTCNGLNITSSSMSHSEDEYCNRSTEDNSEFEVEQKPRIKMEYPSFLRESLDRAFSMHRPIIEGDIKREIKTEDDCEDSGYRVKNGSFLGDINTLPPLKIKDEPPDNEDMFENDDEEDEEDEDDDEDDGESVFPEIDYSSYLDKMIDHSKKLSSLREAIP